jgi:hypothetical protein
MMAMGRTIDATGIMRVVNKLVYKSMVPRSLSTDAAKANVEAAPKTRTTVPLVISRLFPKKFNSGLSRITVAKFCSVIGKVNNAGWNAASGDLRATLTM